MLTINVPPVFTIPQGSSFSYTAGASGNTGAVTWATKLGFALPAGLSLNASTGAITGTPTALGSTVSVLLATDTVPSTAFCALYITVVASADATLRAAIDTAIAAGVSAADAAVILSNEADLVRNSNDTTAYSGLSISHTPYNATDFASLIAYLTDGNGMLDASLSFQRVEDAMVNADEPSFFAALWAFYKASRRFRLGI